MNQQVSVLQERNIFTTIVLFGFLLMPCSGQSSGAASAAGPEAAVVSEANGTRITNSIGMTLVQIPAGSFSMGSKDEEGDWMEHPIHTVTIAQPFLMSSTVVTQSQWTAIMKDNPSPWKENGKCKDCVQEGPNYPAVYVSWNDAKEFCRLLSQKEGKTYCLPSEAEWEYCARAFSSGKWCFGDDERMLEKYAWYEKNAWSVGEKYAHRVATKWENAFGLYDLHGNVWQWCEDRYHANYNGAPNDGTAWIIGSLESRVQRGGSFLYDANDSRSAFRYHCTPGHQDFHVGFRVVCAART